MPPRVRCRCGEVLVVRRAEWIYPLTAIALVAAFLTGAFALTLWTDVERARKALRATEAELASARATPLATPPSAGASDESRTGATSAGESTPASSRAPDDDSQDGASTAAALASEPEVHVLGSEGAPDDDSLLAALRRQIRSREPGTREPPAREAPDPSVDDRAPLVDLVPLLRFALLEASDDELIEAGALLDPEPRIARRALRRLIARPVDTLAPEIFTLARAARPWLREDSLESWLAGRPEPSLGGGETSPPMTREIAWARARDRAATALSSHVELSTLGPLSARVAEHGTDLVLAIDTSRSMDEALDAVREGLDRWLPVLGWGLPRLRVGLVLYRDEVELATDFLERVDPELLAPLRATRAEGGGDVPEGVWPALRAALELGRFEWRESAAKHIVFLGDGPPRHGERRAITSLARAARDEGQFSIHTIATFPEPLPDGSVRVAFFDEISAAGGGRELTVPDVPVEEALLLCLLGDDARTAILRASDALLQGP